MKKSIKSIICYILVFSFVFSGCKNISQINIFTSSDDIKEKYEDEEKYVYEDKVQKITDSQIISYPLGESIISQHFDEGVKAFIDSDFEQEIPLSIYCNVDTNCVDVAPMAGYLQMLQEQDYSGDYTWGAFSRIYLVQYINFKTGNIMGKPLVTIYEIEKDLEDPVLTQYVREDGLYSLKWDEVEGADYYEVYHVNLVSAWSEYESTVTKTNCSYKEFIQDTYDDPTSINAEVHGAFAVVAKSDDGKTSGVSNICFVEDIADRVPYYVDFEFQTEYRGRTPLALPTYVSLKTINGKKIKCLLDYSTAVYTDYGDRIKINILPENIKLGSCTLYLTGISYDDFMEECSVLVARQEKQDRKMAARQGDLQLSVKTDVEIEAETESETEETVTKENATKENETKENTEKADTSDTKYTEINLSEQLLETVYANTALSEWFAINMLNHNEEISIADFSEALDKEYLNRAVEESYRQNPLIGVISGITYSYTTKKVYVDYELTKEETEEMQKVCLEKAAEIAAAITTEDMSDYEKEKAINNYICDNSEYDYDILNYLDSEGMVKKEASQMYTHSFTPYGILIENHGICESYSEAFLLIARAAGLECIIMCGSVDGVGHEWNLVNIEGQWYTLDVTSNDTENYENMFFNLPDSLADTIYEETLNAIMPEYRGNYTASGLTWEYYNMEGRYAQSEEEAVDILKQRFEEGVNVLNVRIDISNTYETAENIAQEFIDEVDPDMDENWYYEYYAGVITIIKD